MSRAATPGPVAGATAAPALPPGIEERVIVLADEIVDPCSAAQALPIGLVSMGMLLGVEAAPVWDEGELRWALRLRLRTTGPGCLYVVYFERELRARIEALPEVASLELEWDGAWDWTPDAIAPGPRAALAERHRRLSSRNRATLEL